MDKTALARKLMYAAGGLTLVSLVGFGLWNFFMERPPKHARVVARDLPDDSLGMVAFADPEHALELLDETIPKEVRDALEDRLGADPFVISTYEDWGLDLGAPIGAAVTDADGPTVVVSIGLSDADAARKGIESMSERLGLGLSWDERSYEGVEGLWLEEPPVAILFHDDRLIAITNGDGDDREVERTAETIAKLGASDSLATNKGFRQLHRVPGDPIAFSYFNVAEIGSEIPFADRYGADNIEGVAVVLASDGRDIHLVMQTVLAADTDYMKYIEGRDRPTRALDSVPAPVFAGFHWSVDPDYAREVIDELARIDDDSFAELEHELARNLGVDLERDLLAAWTGEFGVLWTGAGDDEWGGVAFAGVRDEDAADDLLAGVWRKTDGGDKRSTDAGTVYSWDERPPAAAKVWDGYVWFGVGESRIEQIDDDAKGFRKTTETKAIAKAIRSSDSAVGFLDIRSLWTIRDELGGRRNPLEQFSRLIGELDALTMRTSADGDTFVTTLTLHTQIDDAFDTLTTRALELVFDEAASELSGLIPGRHSCEDVADHIAEMFTKEMPEVDAEMMATMRTSIVDECETSGVDIDCAMAAETIEDLARCEN